MTQESDGGKSGKEDVEIFPVDFGGKGIDLNARVVEPSPIAESKSPSVERASDGTFFHDSAGERSTLMGAEVLDGVELTAVMKNGDHAIFDRVGAAFSFGNIGGRCDA